MLLCRINLDHNGEWDGLLGGRLTLRSLTNSDTPPAISENLVGSIAPLANGHNAGWTGTAPARAPSNKVTEYNIYLSAKV